MFVCVLSKKMFVSKYSFSNISNMSEIDDSCKILIIDIELVDKLENELLEFSSSNRNIIVISDRYNHDDAMYVYAKMFNYYVQINDSGDLDTILDMIQKTKYNYTNIEFSPISNEVVIDGNVITLTNKEMKIYTYLYNKKGVICYRSEMLENVLGYHQGTDSRSIDVYIKFLRNKLGKEGKKIETIRGKGYIYHL